MKEKIQQGDEIKEEVLRHETEKNTPPEFITYEKMTEKELLAEYKKEKVAGTPFVGHFFFNSDLWLAGRKIV